MIFLNQSVGVQIFQDWELPGNLRGRNISKGMKLPKGLKSESKSRGAEKRHTREIDIYIYIYTYSQLVIGST